MIKDPDSELTTCQNSIIQNASIYTQYVFLANQIDLTNIHVTNSTKKKNTYQ